MALKVNMHTQSLGTATWPDAALRSRGRAKQRENAPVTSGFDQPFAIFRALKLALGVWHT